MLLFTGTRGHEAGRNVDYRYDGMQRMWKATVTDPDGSEHRQFTYTYDANSNRTRATRTDQATVTSDVEYAYDPRTRHRVRRPIVVRSMTVG